MPAKESHRDASGEAAPRGAGASVRPRVPQTPDGAASNHTNVNGASSRQQRPEQYTEHEEIAGTEVAQHDDDAFSGRPSAPRRVRMDAEGKRTADEVSNVMAALGWGHDVLAGKNGTNAR